MIEELGYCREEGCDEPLVLRRHNAFASGTVDDVVIVSWDIYEKCKVGHEYVYEQEPVERKLASITEEMKSLPPG